MFNMWMPLLGGSLIALSSSLNYILFGKITGLSGYLYISVTRRPKDLFLDRITFLIGLVTVIDVFHQVVGDTLWGEKVLGTETKVNALLMAIGGALVGIGVRYGGGCTSGHGVCGLPRLSIRSFVAVPTFMAFGMVTATYLAKIGPVFTGFEVDLGGYSETIWVKYLPRVVLTIYQILVFFFNLNAVLNEKDLIEKIRSSVFFITGCIFGVGLLISGMCNRNKILGFLTLGSNWDPSLMFVMGAAVGINFFTFQAVMFKQSAVFAQRIDRPAMHLDLRAFVGPALFGIGWGITGFCPGPALANLTVIGYALPLVLAIFAGQFVQDQLDQFYYERLKKKFN